MENRIADKYLL